MKEGQLKDGELKQLREALRRVKHEAASLADAQVIALEALTQRPAAQTEREAFESAALAKWGQLDFERSEAVPEMYYNQRLDDAWIGFGFAVAWLRASLPAPQQATPATPEDMKVYDGIAAGYFADTQQAAPEPVGEVVAYREKLTGRLCEPEDTHRRKFPMCYEPLTRPAPGVPEGFVSAQAEFNQAIDFAIKEGIGAAVFLDAWRHGDTSEWPEFAAAQAKGGQ